MKRKDLATQREILSQQIAIILLLSLAGEPSIKAGIVVLKIQNASVEATSRKLRLHKFQTMTTQRIKTKGESIIPRNNLSIIFTAT
jgi:hypothetical protein